MSSAFEQIGADALRAILEDFYDRVLSDPMIGFLFAGADRDRLVQKEWELSAAMLGGPVRYTGKPMRQAHARAPILGGHFERRQQLLRDTLADHGVPEQIATEWLSHNDRLRPQVTADAGSGCDHVRAEERLVSEAKRLPLAPAPSASSPPSRRNLVKIGRWNR